MKIFMNPKKFRECERCRIVAKNINWIIHYSGELRSFPQSKFVLHAWSRIFLTNSIFVQWLDKLLLLRKTLVCWRKEGTQHSCRFRRQILMDNPARKQNFCGKSLDTQCSDLVWIFESIWIISFIPSAKCTHTEAECLHSSFDWTQILSYTPQW